MNEKVGYGKLNENELIDLPQISGTLRLAIGNPGSLYVHVALFLFLSGL